MTSCRLHASGAQLAALCDIWLWRSFQVESNGGASLRQLIHSSLSQEERTAVLRPWNASWEILNVQASWDSTLMTFLQSEDIAQPTMGGRVSWQVSGLMWSHSIQMPNDWCLVGQLQKYSAKIRIPVEPKSCPLCRWLWSCKRIWQGYKICNRRISSDYCRGYTAWISSYDVCHLKVETLSRLLQ